jgi:hypothetical protein
MTRSQIWITLAAITLAFFAAPAIADDVLDLTPDNFDNEVGKDRGALIEFFAPWFFSFFLFFFQLLPLILFLYIIIIFYLICSQFPHFPHFPDPIYNSIM